MYIQQVLLLLSGIFVIGSIVDKRSKIDVIFISESIVDVTSIDFSPFNQPCFLVSGWSHN